MGNQMSDCCQDTISNDTHDLRTQTSDSLLLIERAKQDEQTINAMKSNKSIKSKTNKSKYSFGIFTSNSALKLQSIDSSKSTNHGLQNKENASFSISDEIIYSLESSDSENDETLSNDIIREKLISSNHDKCNKVFIKIAESSTTSADHKLEEAVITEPVNNKKPKTRNRYKQIMRAKNKNMSYSMGALKQELSECEIKLKQEQHEKDILRRENEALQEKISIFHEKYGVIDSGFDLNALYTKTTLTNAVRSTSTEKGYDPQCQSLELSQFNLLSPSHSSINNNNNNTLPSSSPVTPMAINWSNSSNLELTTSPSSNMKGMENISPSHTNSTNINHYTSTNDDIDNNPETNINLENISISISPSILINVSTTPDGTKRTESGFSMICKSRSHSVPDLNQKTNSMISMDVLCIDNDEEDSLEIDHGNDNEIECESIESCQAIKRIIDALQWYSISGDDHESVYKKMKTNNYGKKIVDDYNHIMEYHLNDKKNNNIDIKHEYNLIINEVNKYVKSCTFVQCAGYRRYLRSRNENVHKAQTIHQHEVQMYVNTMDGIHCCFMHLAKTFHLE